MENQTKLPKQLKHDDTDYPSAIIDQSGRTVCNVNVYSNPNVKQEIINRYNNFPGMRIALIVMTVIACVSAYGFLYFKL